MNYTEFVAALTAETNIEATNAGLVAILPTIIDQAEGKIYREPKLDFLSAVVTDETGVAGTGAQQFTLPRQFVVLQQINLIDGNERPPLVKLAREPLQYMFTSRIASSPGAVPYYWAPFTDNIVLLGPVPGSPTQLECIGRARPLALSAANPTNWLWSNLPDFAFAAAMIFASAYMRNFGSQADDPKMALSWQSIYDGLLPGAESDETRRKYEATGGA